MIMKNFFLLSLLLCLFGPLSAQDLYTVKVGTFRDVKADDFAAFKNQGFIYGAPGPENTTDVYIGQFINQAKAMTAAQTLSTNGFRNAQAMLLPLGNGQQVTAIQIAFHSGTRPIDWSTLERAGQLYVESIDGVTKILTGIYPDTRTAASFLPAIRELGYTDAFVRKVNNVRLIPITPFETGIKKPLIPLSLQTAKNTPQASGSPNPVPNTSAPETYGSASSASPQPYNPPTPSAYGGTTTVLSPNNTPATVLPAAANAPNLPAIDGRTKRHSAAELQRVLKEKGYYTGSIDGYYGPGTTSAYESAWADMPEVRKYRKLSEIAQQPAATTDPVSQWPEVKVLLAVTEDLSAGTSNDTRARLLVQQRPQLITANQPLNAAAASRVNNWAATVWANLGDWAVEDPLHAQIFSAFRISYHQTMVRLEDHYMQQGLSANNAKDLATAMLQNLTGAQLDRFL